GREVQGAVRYHRSTAKDSGVRIPRSALEYIDTLKHKGHMSKNGILNKKNAK
ncbi:unnamed protein product, partial [Nesidiocoris tenuis]